MHLDKLRNPNYIWTPLSFRFVAGRENSVLFSVERLIFGIWFLVPQYLLHVLSPWNRAECYSMGTGLSLCLLLFSMIPACSLHREGERSVLLMLTGFHGLPKRKAGVGDGGEGHPGHLRAGMREVSRKTISMENHVAHHHCGSMCSVAAGVPRRPTQTRLWSAACTTCRAGSPSSCSTRSAAASTSPARPSSSWPSRTRCLPCQRVSVWAAVPLSRSTASESCWLCLLAFLVPGITVNKLRFSLHFASAKFTMSMQRCGF